MHSNTPSSATQPSQRTSSRFDNVVVALAVGWLATYFVYFYGFVLPNDPLGHSRFEIWRGLPQLFGYLFAIDEGPAAGSWANFPQRFPILLVAGVILAGAWALGHLVLRLLNPPLPARSLERTVLAFGVGLSGLSLLTLGFGYAGLLHRELLGGLIAACVLAEIVFRLSGVRGDSTGEKELRPRRRRSRWVQLPVLCGLAMAPFLLAMALGAMLPSVDFDVKEYHFLGPKEFFLDGQISFLPHNVYTSFPFLTEMLTLLAMVLYGDWYWGAVAGKAVLMAFAPLGALGLLAAGRRWFSPAAGWLAALVYLSTPWIYRISIFAYAEGGLTFYLFATLLAVMIALDKTAEGTSLIRQGLLAGLLAGSAMACKYTGVVSVVIPMGAALVIGVLARNGSMHVRTQQALKVAVAFTLGTLITIGPWLLKNTIETGNPVYPLLYSVLGGRDWDAELNAKWKAAHSATDFSTRKLGENFIDVTSKSDWLSPLLFGLAALAFFARCNLRGVWLLSMYVVYLFVTWWLFTHRIDRFWVPMIPVVALLAGVGGALRTNAMWRLLGGGLIAAALVFNLVFITTPLCGLNTYLINYDEARDFTANISSPEVLALNKMKLPPTEHVLSVGDAELFDATFGVVYNTVFDHSIFQDWCAVEKPDVPASELALRDPADIRGKLQDEQIRFVYVNWAEILRYRVPGSYGYTDFVTPDRFQELYEAGVLGLPVPGQTRVLPFETLSASEATEINEWAPSLKQTRNGTTWFIASQVFPVLP